MKLRNFNPEQEGFRPVKTAFSILLNMLKASRPETAAQLVAESLGRPFYDGYQDFEYTPEQIEQLLPFLTKVRLTKPIWAKLQKLACDHYKVEVKK